MPFQGQCFFNQVYVIVELYPWYNFCSLFWCMVIYDDEYKTRENTRLYQGLLYGTDMDACRNIWELKTV